MSGHGKARSWNQSGWDDHRRDKQAFWPGEQAVVLIRQLFAEMSKLRQVGLQRFFWNNFTLVSSLTSLSKNFLSKWLSYVDTDCLSTYFGSLSRWNWEIYQCHFCGYTINKRAYPKFGLDVETGEHTPREFKRFTSWIVVSGRSRPSLSNKS